jgi:hypothetical protein
VKSVPLVTLPEGRKGDWAVERFEVSKRDADFNNVRSLFSGDRPIQPGTYTRLTYRGSVIMSDTPMERCDHIWPVIHSHGHCLVNGLGIGMVTNAMLLRKEVTKVTVVEISPDVIALVAPHYQSLYGDRFEVVNEDAFTYKPIGKYGMVWHDIWADICTDNLEEMTKLKRKYGRRTDLQGCWCEAETRRAARR